MNGKRAPISAELRPFVDRSEAEQIDQLAQRLLEAKPAPADEFRSALRDRLQSRRGFGLAGWRPRNVRLTAAAFGGSGLVLLVVSYLAAR